MKDSNDTKAVGAKVKAFYEEMPFRTDSIAELKKHRTALAKEFHFPPFLKNVLDRASKVIDIGCGTGERACAMAARFKFEVLGVDMTESALAKAQAVAQAMELTNVTFARHNIFELPYGPEFDFVHSEGVLHHTGDCRKALSAICKLVKVRGHIYVGLYHKHSRQPFLDLFSDLRRKIADGVAIPAPDIEAAFDRFKSLWLGLQGARNDHSDLFIRSWFRDQVLHPHETQHTFKEVSEWLTAEGFVNLLAAGSGVKDGLHAINGPDDSLFEDEKAAVEVANEYARKGQYYTGYMMLLGQKSSQPPA